jgi:hypothetical protein
MCMICSDLVSNAHRTICCRSIYCLECIQKWINKGTNGGTSHTCPYCRAVIAEEHLSPDSCLDAISAAMERPCPQKEFHSCTFRGSRAAVLAHKDSCLLHYQTAALTGIVDHLRHGDEIQRGGAAKTLLIMLKQYPGLESKVVEMDGIRELINTLRVGPEDAWYYVNLCFDLLAMDQGIKQLMMDLGVCEPLVSVIRTAGEAVLPNAMLLLSKCVIFNKTNQDIFAAAGAIPLLVGHLTSDVLDVQSNAAGALWNMAGKNRENQVAMARGGVFPPLIGLVVRRADTINAAGALWNIIATSDPVHSIKVTDIEVLRSLVATFPTVDQLSREWIIGCFDTLTSSNPHNTPVVVEAGGVAPTVGMLGTEYTNDFVLHQIIAVLSRVCQLCPHCTGEMITLGAVSALVEVIQRPLETPELEQVALIKENSVRILRQLCCDSTEVVASLAERRAVTALLQLLANTTMACVEQTLYLLQDLCKLHSTARRTVASSEAGLRTLASVLDADEQTPTVITEVIETLKPVCQEFAAACGRLVTVGTVPVLVRRCSDDCEEVREGCASLLCLMATQEGCREAMRSAGLQSSSAIGYTGPGAW